MPSLFQDVLREGIEHDHHETDLYLPDTPRVRELLEKHGKRVDGWNVQRFRSEMRDPVNPYWLDIPFAYEPGWRK